MSQSRQPHEPASSSSLKDQARARGVQTQYWDVFGKLHEPSTDVLQALVTALGPADTDPVPPTLVITEGASAELPPGIEQLAVSLEDERTIELGATAELPANLPVGYHSLQWTWNGKSGHSDLIVCPPRVWGGNDIRQTGVAISLYGLRSARNWGCGDFRDLKDFTAWVASEIGGGFVALNPLHAIHNRQPFNTSPYLPLSSYFRNFLYLDIEAIEEFAGPACQALFAQNEIQKELAALRSSEFVEYERIAALKMRFLRLAFHDYCLGSHGDFDEFQARGGSLLQNFALFCALDEHFRVTKPGTWLWTQWPHDFHHPDSPACRAFANAHELELRFHCWLQWQIDRQLDSAQAHTRQLGMPIGLYHDLALATDRFGCDLWSHPDHFAVGCRVGAPPDGFSPEGQDWAFPPPNSAVARRSGYKLFVESIRRNARHGGALRMDHVMRLFRLFWIPEHFAAKDGTYVHEPWRDLLGILALESHRMKFRVIGEDLGTLNDEIRNGLDEYGVLSYKVLYFERNDRGDFRAPEEYAKRAVATVTTHDLPTLAGFWINRDIESRLAAGLLPSQESYQRQLAERAADKQALLARLHEESLLPADFPRDAATIPELTAELHEAIMAFLSSTPCELLAINQEDLTLEVDQQNLPGSTAEYPNWRRKMKYTLEQLHDGVTTAQFTGMLRRWIERSGRLNETPA